MNLHSTTYLVFLFIFFLFNENISGQYQVSTRPDIRHITQADGLDDQAVYKCIRDSLGYIWLAHRKGLNRYDGHSMESFPLSKKKRGQTKIIQMVLFNDHLILLEGLPGFHMVSAKHIYFLCPYSSQSIDVFDPIGGAPPFDIEKVEWIDTDDEGHLLFLVADESLWHLDQQFKWTQIIAPGDIPNAYFNPNRNHIFTSNQIVLSDFNHTSFLILNTATSQNFELKADDVGQWYVFPDRDSIKVFRRIKGETQHAIYLVQNDSLELITEEWTQDISSFFNYSYSGEYHRPQTLLLTPNKGLGRYANSQYDIILPAIDVPFNEYEFNSAFSYDKDKLWLCTTKGLFIVSIQSTPFRRWLHQEKVPIPRLSDQMRSLYTADDSILYAGQWVDFTILNLKTGSTERYNLPNKDVIYSLYPLGDSILIGSDGLYLFDKNGLIKRLANIPANSVWDILQVNTEDFVLCTNKCLFLYNRKNNTLRKLENSCTKTDINIYYKAILENDTIWIAGDAGVIALDRSYNLISQISKNQLETKNILTFHKEGPVFWLGSYNNGLLKWNYKTDKLQIYTVASGLPSDDIFTILQDDEGYLWLGTSNGLAKFDPSTEDISVFSEEDGLPFTEFNRISAFKSQNGIMYFGGLNGFIQFNPKLVETPFDTTSAPFRITKINQYDVKTDQWRSLPQPLPNELQILPGDRIFEVELALLDFESGPYQYQYQIKGLENAWYPVRDNVIRINNLPYGQYTLLIKAQNPKGLVADTTIELPIHVKTPFYLSSLFFIIVFLALIIIILLIVKWRERNIMMENIKLEQEVARKTEALTLALKTKEVLLKELKHRTQNNLSIMESMLELQKDKSSTAEAIEVLDKTQNRLRSISLIHHNLDMSESVNQVHFNNFIRDIIQQFQSILQSNIIQFDLKFSSSLTYVLMEKAVPIALIINEMITNSFKHGAIPGKTLNIAIDIADIDDDTLRILYRDDGNGPPGENKKNSENQLGMKLINLLCKQIKGQLKEDYSQGVSYEITLRRKTIST